MYALSVVFRDSMNQMCRWHIEQNILKNCRKHFDTLAEFDEFMKCIRHIASSMDHTEQETSLQTLQDKFPGEAVNYFLNQWWRDGQCERWAEYHISRYPNFGMNTTSRVEGSHAALKRSLSSSSVTLRSRYLLPCSHQIQLGVPIDINQIHPRWRVQVSLPVLEVTKQNLDASVLSLFKDPVVLLKRKGRPRGTRRLQTSAEIVQRAESVRRCGSCHQAGHNRRSCGKLRAKSTAMHEGDIAITGGISDIHDQENHPSNTVDNNEVDEDRDGEEDGEKHTEHIEVSSLTDVWDDVLASL
ncbi:hypothetical protein V1525DRAFT_68283 [Lipomyces kononenkoae]|uniref:Uncharacterized protein n=1 Tax=Lipomyces kononenkoae TaxID=34357 RepID=A0ACC3T4T6_LIPKO